MANWQKNLDQAFNLSDEKRYTDALVYFDLVEKEGGYGAIYYERGCCLQSVDYHLDAIDDFTKDIDLCPGKAVSYFMRSMSYLQLGLLNDAWLDNITAIQLSKNNTEENKEANIRSKKMGHDTATLFYELRLDFVKQRSNMTETTRNHLAKPRIRRNK